MFRGCHQHHNSMSSASAAAVAGRRESARWEAPYLALQHQLSPPSSPFQEKPNLWTAEGEQPGGAGRRNGRSPVELDGGGGVSRAARLRTYTAEGSGGGVRQGRREREDCLLVLEFSDPDFKRYTFRLVYNKHRCYKPKNCCNMY